MTSPTDIVQKHYDKILNHVRNKLPQPECYDIAQECVVTFCEKDPSQIKNPDAFLWGIVRNKIKQFYESRNKLIAAARIYEMLSVEVIATRLSTKVACRNDLEGALQKLPLRYQQTFEFRYIEGLSLDECAEALDRSPATVKRDLEAARQGLAKLLGQRLESEDDTDRVVRSYLERR
ncbi:RNA polymerase sigma factor [Nannocystaceae bacterium ST9]